MDREPQQLGTLDESMVRLHEIFESMLRAGFTEAQATAVIAEVVTYKLKRPGISG